MAKVALIADLKARGLTWRQIAPAINARDGKEAKRAAKNLARAAHPAALRALAEEADRD